MVQSPERSEGQQPALPMGARSVETHVSVLFFLGDRVYKIRKPVEFGFLDFRERELREADCQREVVLNRRLAPDVYLGVADVVLDNAPIEHMVVMRRMPEERCMALLARRGDDLDEILVALARTLVVFHDRAPRSPEISAASRPAALEKIWEANFAETDPFVGTVLDSTVEAEIRELAHRWIKGRAPLLAQRIASGRICDGHGDLQAEDIFCLADGVRVLDCLEFSDRLRHGDVCADVAFLAMDLERLGRLDAAKHFLASYQELAGDRFCESLLQHYWASRAYVRTTVSCLRGAQGATERLAEARRLQDLTLAHLREGRVRLVLLGGPPGSGKSTLAGALAAEQGWTVLRSDEIRREVQATPGPETAGWRAGRYSPERTAWVYEEMIRRAEACLGSGESVILDASWADAVLRTRARAAAVRTSSDLLELCCALDEEEAEARIVRRMSQGGDISEANPEIASAVRRAMDPWEQARVLDTSGMTPDATLAAALALLDT
jgi:hypothetical protein